MAYLMFATSYEEGMVESDGYTKFSTALYLYVITLTTVGRKTFLLILVLNQFYPEKMSLRLTMKVLLF